MSTEESNIIVRYFGDDGRFPNNEVLPWSVINVGTPNTYLVKEQQRAQAAMGA